MGWYFYCLKLLSIAYAKLNMLTAINKMVAITSWDLSDFPTINCHYWTNSEKLLENLIVKNIEASLEYNGLQGKQELFEMLKIHSSNKVR